MSALAPLDTSKTIQSLRPPDPPDGHNNSNDGKKVDSYLPLSFHALWTDPAAASPDDQAQPLSTEQKPQASQPDSSISASASSNGLTPISKALPAIPSPALTATTSTQDLAPFSTSTSMVTRPDSAADRVNAIFARRHALTNRARVSGPATPPATTQLHQLTLAGNGNANASTSNVSIISSPATTITVSPRSSASLESFGEGETEVDGEDLTGGTFVSTSTSASASAEEAETPDEDECAAADASADTIRTQRATRASNTGTIKAKNGQSPGALLEMLVNENGGLFKENEKLRAQLVTLRSEALIVERAKREKARQERADAIGIPKLHAASKLQHKPQELHAVVPPPKLLSALPSPPQVQITPAPGKKRTVEELQKKLERRREKHEITRRKLAWTKQQWASADYAGTVFATCFKQQRVLADERGLAVESLETKNGELQKRNEELEQLLLAMTLDRDAMASEREALKESEAITQARVVELNARNAEVLEHIARLETQSSILEERSSLAEEKNRDLAEKNAAQVEEITRLAEQRDSVIEENTRLADKDTSYRHTNAKLLDRNAKLSLTIDDLETRVEELYSQFEGLQARNEELCETIHLLREREEELEVIIEESKAEIADLQQVAEEFETAYNNLCLNGAGSARGDHDERASVTSEDMDINGLEAAANAVGEDGEYIDVPEQEGDNDATPSRSRTRTRSATYDRPPSTLSDVDTSDPIIVAAQIKRLQRLVDEYHDAIASLRRKRQAQEDRAVELAAIEDDLQKRLDEYKEISIDFRQRESDYFASCELREREFLDLSDEYERWRMDCEVREVDVEEDRIEVWRFRNEVEARLARCIKREEVVRRREGEVRWRMMCLDGAFGDREGEGCKCWRCLEPPAELFPPTPPTNFEWLDEEYEKKFGSPRRGRQADGQQSQQEEATRSREDEMDERYLREDMDDAPFEFDGREAVKRYLADQERHERERREDEYVDMEEEAERIRLSAEAYDEVVHGRVAELIRKADEKRRQIKERKERAAAGPSDGEIFGVYDESLAQLNVDGLHGLGFVENPDSYPDRYVEEDAEAEAGPSTSMPAPAPVPVAPVASTSSRSSSNALADSSATRDSCEGGVGGELSSSWEEVHQD